MEYKEIYENKENLLEILLDKEDDNIKYISFISDNKKYQTISIVGQIEEVVYDTIRGFYYINYIDIITNRYHIAKIYKENTYKSIFDEEYIMSIGFIDNQFGLIYEKVEIIDNSDILQHNYKRPLITITHNNEIVIKKETVGGNIFQLTDNIED